MIITAALAWWDEPPDELEACVRGMANLADRVVAFDGAYRRYPGATITSPPEQAEAIRRTAADVGLECLIMTPDRLWAGQLEKRTALYNVAAIGSDWIVVVDSDHIIKANRQEVRDEIGAMPLHEGVISAPYPVPIDTSRSLDESAATGWHRDAAGKADQHRLLFRAYPGLRVEYRHWFVSGIINGERQWIIHSDGQPALPAVNLIAYYEVEHRCLFRDERRVMAGRAFCNDRVGVVALTGQEDDVPGLPPPDWDVASIPYRTDGY